MKAFLQNVFRLLQNHGKKPTLWLSRCGIDQPNSYSVEP
jgi:hypothetical protein